jgi:hypothetical protein
MRHRPWIRFLVATCGLFALSPFACGGSEGGNSCGQLQNYTASTTTTLSFATDVHPIMSNSTFAIGCSQETICHGTPAMNLDPAMMKTFSLIDAPATVKTALLQQVPVNAPSMKFVVPGNVGASFLAYKISDASVLACVNSMCASGASIGESMPCGDPMPIGGILTAAERTKILDWIAQGAAD